MSSQTFNVSPDKIATFRAQLGAQGVQLPAGNSGQFSTEGVTLGFEYDGTSKLVISIMAKPWYATEGEVWDKITPYLA